ncbi:MAG: hypothetical protein RL326_1855 [Pseudomonadota bacterium]
MGVEISFILGLCIALVAVPFFDLPEFVRVYGPKRFIKRARNSLVLWNRLARRRMFGAVADPHHYARGNEESRLRHLSKNTAIITCYFNPANLPTVEREYRRFMREVEWWEGECFSAELAFPGQEWPSPSAFIQLRAGENQMLWQRERLLNLIVERLPSSYDTIAVIDPTILLLNGSALAKAELLLATANVVELCRDVHSVDERGEVVATYRKDVRSEGESDELACAQPRGTLTVGFLARRGVFPLYDRCVYGFGQALTGAAWRGTELSSVVVSPHERAHYKTWATQAFSRVRGRVTSIEGACITSCSAAGESTLLERRENGNPKLEFDPSRHIGIDEHGLLVWQEGAPLRLMDEVRDNLSARTLFR